jgi:hypothetical protein
MYELPGLADLFAGYMRDRRTRTDTHAEENANADVKQ